MATFSENQVRHLYVVKSASDFSVGTIDKDLFFNMKNADNETLRSDLITNVMYAKLTTAEKMQRKLKAIKVTAADADMVAGQDYVLRVSYRKFISQSDEDTYLEVASARAKKTNDDVEVLLKDLAKNLYANTKTQGLVEVKALVSTSEVAIPNLQDSDVVTAIIIREIEQPWTLGVNQVESVDFTVTSAPITKDTIDYDWATIEEYTTNAVTIGNGKITADLEYFCLGERGDIYRNVGWPKVIPTRYMVDETKQYDYIDIHYAYVGSNHAVQKSEKDITLVVPCGTVASPDHEVTSAVIQAINEANIITIPLPTAWGEEEYNVL